MPEKNSKNTHFESQLEQLESIVEQLEDGDLSLEDSLKAFEKGVKLSRSCQKLLSDAEQKVTILMEDQEKEFNVSSEHH